MLHNSLKFLLHSDTPGSRRRAPRIDAPAAFCVEVADEREQFATIADLSPTGLRLHRPFRGAPSKIVQLEFDLPGCDDVIWAKGAICFDHIWQPRDGAPMLHTSGVQIIAAARCQLERLKEYAYDFAPRLFGAADRRAVART